ncbi:ABC transporter ATP-binding protein/permease, partial [Candidatus Pelagibacter sp.]|nr:ABC transporter ATP-binding protein/permease [Candidatus Pelagibacter sp.]
MKKLKKLFNNEEFIFFKIILLLNSVMFFLEGISLISIPIFASILIDSSYIFDKFDILKNNSYLAVLEHNQLIILFGSIVIISFVVKNVFLIFLTIFQGNFQKKIKTNIAEKLFRYYINMPYLLHLEKNPAYLSRYVSTEIANLNTYLINFILHFREVITIFVIFILLIFSSPGFILLIFFVFGLIGLLFLKTIKSFINLRAKKNIELGKNLTETIYETFGSIKDIKVQMKENKVIDYFKKDFHQLENNNYYFFIIEKLPKIILEFLAISILVLISVFFINKVNNITEMLPVLSLILVSIFRFLPAFNAVTVSRYYMRLTKPSVEIIADEINKSSIIAESQNFSDDKKNYNLDKNRYLEVKNLSFSYDNKHSRPLKNINFEIKKGEFIGITGKTGSGKSTLFLILMGLLKSEGGVVSHYGQNINKDIRIWKKKLGYVSQNIFLLNGSLKKNILLNFDSSDDENCNYETLNQCMEIAELKPKIDSLQYGLDTHIGINGSKLSGGEKQRLAIARVLYRDPEIILMDESTNALDEKTEDKILNNLRSETLNKKTILIISHRKNTLNKCDKVLNLDLGEI